ncbi:hypothetical protein GH5_03434 [Leishmania sp. Ghana 2012 LV757]|uniref:hypothetical protein n=1 Tax=Leishmania sp. Ghana 2012 LV757 TaxID=2803181 RepID=UPI001B5E3CD0|nr:hypothetical protein GH5_03434 [Leishmania sp. Ghana 2012 LV757]
MPTTTTATEPRYRRRESGRSVFHRLHAIPVQLLPPHVFTLQHAAGEGNGDTDKDTPCVSPAAAFGVAKCDPCAELGMNSVCLVTSAAAAPLPISPTRASATGDAAFFSTVGPPAAEQRFSYEVAAAHALRGGRVLFLCAPTSQAFSLAMFAVIVEKQWVSLERGQHEAQSARKADTGTTHDANNARPVGCARGPTWPSTSACAVTPAPASPSLSSEAQLRARERAVLAAVQRVEVLPCTSMEDLYAVCQAYTFPPVAAEAAPQSPTSVFSPVGSPQGSGRPRVAVTSAFPPSPSLMDSDGGTPISAVTLPAPQPAFLETASAPTSAGVPTPHQVDIVPLCIVDGFMGPLSTPTLLERASGQTIPLPHYVLCLLQRRLKCAVMVLEGEASVSTGGGARWAHSLSAARLPSASSPLGQHPRKQSDMCAALPSPLTVLAASDLVQRLRVPHAHPPPVAPVAQAAWFVQQGSAENSSQVGGGGGRQLAKKATRVDGEGENSAHSWSSQASAISLHDVQLSVAYIEWDAVWSPLRHGSRNMQACDGCNDATSAQDELLLPFSLAWRYRVHLMKTSVGEAAGARVGATDSLLHNRQSRSSESLWPPSHSWRRPSGVLGFSSGGPSTLQYTGVWVRSSHWHQL